MDRGKPIGDLRGPLIASVIHEAGWLRKSGLSPMGATLVLGLQELPGRLRLLLLAIMHLFVGKN